MKYKIINASMSHDIEKRMNSLADQGWETLTVFPKAGMIVAVMQRTETND